MLSCLDKEGKQCMGINVKGTSIKSITIDGAISVCEDRARILKADYPWLCALLKWKESVEVHRKTRSGQSSIKKCYAYNNDPKFQVEQTSRYKTRATFPGWFTQSEEGEAKSHLSAATHFRNNSHINEKVLIDSHWESQVKNGRKITKSTGEMHGGKDCKTWGGMDSFSGAGPRPFFPLFHQEDLEGIAKI